MTVAVAPSPPHPVPPAPTSVREAIVAARLGGEWTAFYYRPANPAATRPAVLAAIRHRARGKKLERRRWIGPVDRRGVVHELSVRDWNAFADLATGSALVSHPLLGIVGPAMSAELAILSRGSPEGAMAAARVRALGPRADLLEVVSFFRDPVAPWACATALDPTDRRSAWSHGSGRALLGRVAALDSLSLSSIAALLAPNLDVPDTANEVERKTIAIDAVWPLLLAGLAAFDGAVDPVIEPEPPVPAAGPARAARSDALPVAEIARRARVSEPVAALLAARGLDDPAELDRRIAPDPDRESPNPHGLVGMTAASERIRRAVNDRETILVFGDYDADGLGGTAVLGSFLVEAGADVRTLVGRREHGYGLLMESAESILRSGDPGLVVTIDCGTSNHDSIAYLASGGIDVVVLDHHLALKGAPPTPYFVNPKRDDELYGFREFCGCGVAYKMVQALSSNRHEPALYPLVATSTIADHMAITGENRFFVSSALRTMRRTGQGNLGLAALARSAGRPVAGISERDFGFTLAPRINAVGRMHADPNQVVRLLMSSDYAEVEQIAADMESLNTARKRITDELLARAVAEIGPNPPDFIVSFLPDAGIGVAGLIAGHLVTRYNRPVLVVNEHGRGSGRSPNGGTPIKTYLERFATHPKLAGLEFGGHAHAAGFGGVDPKSLVEVSRTIRVAGGPPPGRPDRVADADLPVRMIGRALVDELFEAEPLLAGETEPLFRLPDVRIVAAVRTTSRDGSPSAHLRMSLVDDTDGSETIAYWFGAGDRLEHLPERADVFGIPSPGRYRAAETNFRIERIARPSGR